MSSITRFSFELQSLIKVKIEAANVEEARDQLINNLRSDEYSEALVSNCNVSDGEKIND